MDSLLSWILIAASTASLLYLYLTRNFNYWHRLGLNGPKPMIGFGTIFYKMFKPMPILEIEWQKQFGNIYGLFLGNEPVLTVLEPELIKDILVKDFNNFIDRRHLNTYHEIVNLNLFFAIGEQWRRIRAIMSPSFTNSKLRSVLPAMEVCVQNTLSFISNKCTRPQLPEEVDMKQVLGNLTMDVIATTAFATKIESNREQNNPFLINAKEFFKFKAYRYLAAFLLPKFMLKYFLKSQFKESTNQFFINTSRKIIETRREKNIKNNDLIQLLMDAELQTKDKDTNYGISNYNKKLTKNEILAQCWVTFLAGYETTSTTLSFCIYELAINNDIQDRLFDELCKLTTNNGNNLTFDVVNKCKYLEAVIFETLRKYPPVIRLERTAANDYRLGNTGITIYKGQVVEIPIYAVHHCEQNFPKPNQFLPERFLPENKKQIKPHTFIPFGDGPRNCIGLKFALMEIKLVLSKLLCQFKFSISSKTQIPIQYNPVTPFLATNCNFLNVEKRF